MFVDYKIGVMGKAARSKDLPAKMKKAAEEVGKELAKQGAVLVTGACMGAPEVAAQSAIKYGGRVLAYSPGANLREHLEPPIFYPFPARNMDLIFTGFGKNGRNVLSIRECDGVIFIDGGMGSLNELSIALQERKAVGVITGVGGLVEEILPKLKKKYPDIIEEKNAKILVKKILKNLEQNKKGKLIRKEIPVAFFNKRNRLIQGIFHLPTQRTNKQTRKAPLAVFVHGFGSNKSQSYFLRLARALAES